ncbi:MAG: arginase [Flavobacteriales bacterium]|jgi:arginase|nr:arginase [Flavobacteriales bacterium]
MKRIVLVENKSEIGAGTRGASLGIDAVKIAALNSKSDYFKKAKIVKIENENDRLWEDVTFESAKRIKGVVEVYKRVSSSVSEVLGKNKFPVILSGDHSNAGGTIAGIKMAYPDKRLGVIWIDAHADLHSPYTSPSGNIHGMPLATALGEDNQGYAVKEISDEVKKQWERLKGIGNINPKIQPEDLVFIGVRDTEDPEDYYIANNKVKTISVEHVRRTGAQEVSEQVLEYLSACDIIYVSFDVDSMDCDLISYGTGTPVQNGLTDQEASGLINHFLIDKRVKCFEVVEINPCLDNKQNKMAETAFRIIEGASAIIEKRG